MARESVKTSTVAGFESLYRETLKIRGRWIARFLEDAPAAAE